MDPPAIKQTILEKYRFLVASPRDIPTALRATYTINNPAWFLVFALREIPDSDYMCIYLHSDNTVCLCTKSSLDVRHTEWTRFMFTGSINAITNANVLTRIDGLCETRASIYYAQMLQLSKERDEKRELLDRIRTESICTTLRQFNVEINADETNLGDALEMMHNVFLFHPDNGPVMRYQTKSFYAKAGGRKRGWCRIV